VAEQAGGAATNGVDRILDIRPGHLHQRTPLVIGSRKDVEFVSEVLREGDGPPIQPRRASDHP
jgi:fructose-1,6-bisphosphatase I